MYSVPLAHFPSQAHLDFKLVYLVDSVSRRLYSEMTTGDWWWDTQDQLSAGAMTVSVICVSDNTDLKYFSGDQHALPLYFMIGNIRKDIWWTPKKHAWILVGLIKYHTKGAKYT